MQCQLKCNSFYTTILFITTHSLIHCRNCGYGLMGLATDVTLSLHTHACIHTHARMHTHTHTHTHTQWYGEPMWGVLFIHQYHGVLQDRGHCGCVPGSEGTPHSKARQCAHCGKLEYSMQQVISKYCTVGLHLSLHLFQRALCPLGALILMYTLGLPQSQQYDIPVHLKTNTATWTTKIIWI